MAVAITSRGRRLWAKLVAAKVLPPEERFLLTCSHLAKKERSLRRLAEEACNGHPCQRLFGMDISACDELQAKWDTRIERQAKRLMQAAVVLAGLMGARAKFSSDPRGAAVKLMFPGHPGDSLGGDGFVID